MPILYLTPNSIGPSNRPFWTAANPGPGGYIDPNYGVSTHPQSNATGGLAGVAAAGDSLLYVSDWPQNPGIDEVFGFPAWVLPAGCTLNSVAVEIVTLQGSPADDSAYVMRGNPAWSDPSTPTVPVLVQPPGAPTGTFPIPGATVTDLSSAALKVVLINMDNATSASPQTRIDLIRLVVDYTNTIPATITKTGPAAAVTAGETFQWTVTVNNPGFAEAGPVTIVDPVPAGVTFGAWTAVASGGATVTPSTGTGAVNATVSTLPAGSSVTFTLAAVAGPPGVVVNTASMTGAATAQADSITTIVPPVSDVVATKTTTTQSIEAGGRGTFWLTYSNQGPHGPVTFPVSDPVPVGVAFQEWELTPSTDGVWSGPSAGTGPIAGNATLGVGQTVQFRVRVTAANPLPAGLIGITNTASAPVLAAPAIEANPANSDPPSATIPITAGRVSVQKTPSPAQVAPGQVLTYRVRVYNDTAVTHNEPAGIIDVPPPELTGVTWTVAGSPGATFSPTAGTGTMALGALTVPPGGWVEATIEGTVAGTLRDQIRNTVTLGAGSLLDAPPVVEVPILPPAGCPPHPAKPDCIAALIETAEGATLDGLVTPTGCAPFTLTDFDFGDVCEGSTILSARLVAKLTAPTLPSQSTQPSQQWPGWTFAAGPETGGDIYGGTVNETGPLAAPVLGADGIARWPLSITTVDDLHQLAVIGNLAAVPGGTAGALDWVRVEVQYVGGPACKDCGPNGGTDAICRTATVTPSDCYVEPGAPSIRCGSFDAGCERFAPMITVTAGVDPVRNVRVRVWPNPDGRPCPSESPQDWAHWNCVDPCFDGKLAYVPAGATVTIDPRDRTAQASCSISPASWQGWQWSTLTGKVCVCVTMDPCATGDATIKIELVEQVG